MKKKRAAILAVLLVFCLTIILSGCSSSGSNSAAATDNSETEQTSNTSSDGQDVSVWNVASIQTEDHPQTQAVIKMGELFSEKTNGRYKFNVYPNELLGPQRETLEQVQYGVIEMAVIGNANISSFVDGFLTFEMPYLFDNIEQQKTFFTNSDNVSDLYAQTEQYNFKIATYFTAGTRNMYASKPIRTLDDLKGMKIRTAESETYSQMMQALGGSATPMSMGEVFTAIQSGVVDGAENNEASYANSKHYEIAPYYSYTQHLCVPDFLIVNTDLYNSLSDEDKQAFNEAAQEAAEYEYQLWDDYSAKAIKTAEDGGATLVTDVDVASMKEAVKPVQQNMLKNSAVKTIYDKVEASKTGASN